MNSKLNFKISGIIAIAVVAAVVGTLAFTSFETNSNQNSQTQSVGIGAYVTVEAYHEDGTMFQKWEGYNDLTSSAQNALVACITGLDTTPFGHSSCNLGVDSIKIATTPQDGPPRVFVTELAEVSLKPDGCNTSTLGPGCTGWEMKSTFDFESLSCTPEVDCLDLFGLNAFGETTPFNLITIEPNIIIIPNDRLVVIMNFTIPV